MDGAFCSVFRQFQEMFALIFTLLFTAILNLGAAQSDCARNHTVVSGDTCNGISAALNVSTFQLAHVNTVIDAACDNLDIGQVLCLGIIGQDCNATDIVVSGDSCSAIALANDIDLAILLVNNRNVNSACSNLLIGTVLCVAAGIIPYT